jgi:hypothetical protein
MNFSELEYVLMVAVAVLLWRNASVKMWAEREERRANKYSRWLIGVYEKKGKIVQKDDGYFFEEMK